MFPYKRTGFLDGLGDPAAVDIEKLGQDCLCAEFAQVEHGGQDPVGIGEPGARPCSGRSAALCAAPLAAGLFSLCFLRSGKVGDQGVQSAAGMPGAAVPAAGAGGTGPGWMV